MLTSYDCSCLQVYDCSCLQVCQSVMRHPLGFRLKLTRAAWAKAMDKIRDDSDNCVSARSALPSGMWGYKGNVNGVSKLSK